MRSNLGPMSGHGACQCRSSRFDVDPYGRLFIPSGVTQNISVVDNNDNPILNFGRYGNWDEQGNGSDVPFACPLAVAASEDYIYVNQGNGERELRLEPRTRDSSYWRDVGTLDAYWNANMDLTGVDPYFNLYGVKWPIHTHQILAPPAKFVFKNEQDSRVGKALDSLVAPGCILSGLVRDSVLAYNVVVRSWATVEESVISDSVVIGRNCKIKKAIIDKENIIPPGTMIGYNPKEDMKRFTVTPRGIVVVPKGYFKD